MKDYFYIPMQDENILKIEQGIKTSTLRTEDSGKKLGIPVGDVVKAKIGRKFYLIQNLGLLTVDEAGGKDLISEKEAFGDNGPLFESTRNWLNGQGKLFVYIIIKQL